MSGRGGDVVGEWGVLRALQTVWGVHLSARSAFTRHTLAEDGSSTRSAGAAK